MLLLTLSFPLIAQETQTYISQDSISNGMLAVSMDTRIDALLEEKENLCATIRFSNTTKNETKTSSSSNENNTTVVKNPFGRDIDNCKLFPKLDGYKIQILYTKSSEEVNKVRANFARYFPTTSTESTYLRPDFKVRAGEYLTREAASRDLKAIKSKFPTAIIVRSVVYCKRAKR